jgi:single-strand DNA-binding protein
MAATNINRVIISGNLTKDPELRTLPSGFSICSMRLATNTRKKDGATGEWSDKANFFDVTVFGKQGENCAQYLAKGRGVIVDGRLEWREWEKDGQKRQAVEIIADTVEFKGGPAGSNGNGNGGGSGDDVAAAAPVGEDDIPF